MATNGRMTPVAAATQLTAKDYLLTEVARLSAVVNVLASRLDNLEDVVTRPRKRRHPRRFSQEFREQAAAEGMAAIDRARKSKNPPALQQVLAQVGRILCPENPISPGSLWNWLPLDYRRARADKPRVSEVTVFEDELDEPMQRLTS